MTRYIDADKLITKIEKLYHDAHIQWNMKDIAERTKNFWCGQTGAFNHSRNIIIDFPTADVVEVKHGYWKEANQIGRGSRHIQYTTKQCSVCGYWNGRKKTKYCPECGAKMDGERKCDNDRM